MKIISSSLHAEALNSREMMLNFSLSIGFNCKKSSEIKRSLEMHQWLRTNRMTAILITNLKS